MIVSLVKIALIVNMASLLILGALELLLPGFVLYFLNLNYLFASFCVIGFLLIIFTKYDKINSSQKSK